MDGFCSSNSTKYAQLQSGVTATVTEITNGFRYRLTMDYNAGDTKIDNIYYYSKGVSPIKINYEMTAEFFTCS